MKIVYILIMVMTNGQSYVADEYPFNREGYKACRSAEQQANAGRGEVVRAFCQVKGE